MELTPGYKQTDFGVLPAEWELKSFADLCVKIQDGTHFSPKGGGHDYLYITSKNIRFGFLDTGTATRIDSVQHQAIYKRCDVKQGDLLITKDGANTGNAALNTLQEEISLLSSVAFLRFDPNKHSSGYFLQQVLSPQGQRRIKDAMSGNAITRLTLEKIRQLRFPVPSGAEQRAIAKTLSDMDALLDGQARLIAKKRDLKQAVMQQLLTGQTRLPGFQVDWQPICLGDVASFHKGQGLPKSDLTPYGDEPCIHYGELFTRYREIIRETISRTNKTKTAAFRSAANDVLMPTSDVTPSGLAKASCVIQSGVILGGDILVIRTDPARISGAFLSFTIRREEEQVLRLVTGTTVFHLYGAEMKKFAFMLPELDEQEAIVGTLAAMDAELAALEVRLEKNRALKQAMMQELLTGRTRVVDREPAHA